jgi:hypothetical protein
MIDLLKGNVRLWIAFWLVPILFIIIKFASLLVVMASNNEQIIQKAIPFFGLLTDLSLVYIWVSIWRCAKNASWVGWSNLAKLVVTITIFLVVSVKLQFAGIISESDFNTLRNFSSGLVIIAGIATSLYLIFFVIRKQLVNEKKTENDSDLITKAKLAYLARNYSEALRLFEAANEVGELDSLAETYMKMCKKRVQTT